VSDDQPVAAIREAPEATTRHRGGPPLGFRWWDGGILLTLENPDVRGDLHQGGVSWPPFENTIPGKGIDALFNRLTDGIDLHTANGWISQQLHVRFWAR